MDTVAIQIVSFQVVALVATLGFLWNLHRDVGSLRKEVGQDVANLRQEVKADMANLRQEVKADMADLRQEVSRDTSEVRKDMAGLRERLVRVESLLEGFIGRPPEPQS